MKSQHSNDVTVVASVESAHPWLPEFLVSVASSYDRDVEIVLALSGVTTSQIHQMVGPSPHLSMVGGAHTSRSDAVAAAIETIRTPFVFLTDSRGVVAAHALTKLVATAKADNSDIVLTSWKAFSSSNTWDPTTSWKGFHARRRGVPLSAAPQLLRLRAADNKLISRRFWMESIEGIEQDIVGGDLELWAALMTRADRISTIPDATYLSRHTSSGFDEHFQSAPDHVNWLITSEKSAWKWISCSDSGNLHSVYWRTVLEGDFLRRIIKIVRAEKEGKHDPALENLRGLIDLLRAGPGLQALSARSRTIYAFIMSDKIQPVISFLDLEETSEFTLSQAGIAVTVITEMADTGLLDEETILDAYRRTVLARLRDFPLSDKQVTHLSGPLRRAGLEGLLSRLSDGLDEDVLPLHKALHTGDPDFLNPPALLPAILQPLGIREGVDSFEVDVRLDPGITMSDPLVLETVYASESVRVAVGWGGPVTDGVLSLVIPVRESVDLMEREAPVRLIVRLEAFKATSEAVVGDVDASLMPDSERPALLFYSESGELRMKLPRLTWRDHLSALQAKLLRE